MDKKNGWIILLHLLLLVTLSDCNFFKSYYEVDEIPANLHTALAEKYGIYLPDTGVFCRAS